MKRDSPEYKLATTIWVLSCNDLPPQMTYKGIVARTDQEDDTLSRAIVVKFPELFQAEIPKAHLADWKSRMLNKKDRPKWIADSKKQTEVINNLELKDTFRNRFRNSIGEPPTNSEILNWGLEYLNEHYSISTESKNLIMNRLGNIVLPILSILLAWYSVYETSSSSKNQLQFEKHRLQREIVVPQVNRFLDALSSSLHIGLYRNDVEYTINQLSIARSTLDGLYPFLQSIEHETVQTDLTTYHNTLLPLIVKDSLSRQEINSLSEQYAKVSIGFSEAVKDKISLSDSLYKKN